MHRDLKHLLQGNHRLLLPKLLFFVRAFVFRVDIATSDLSIFDNP